MPVDRDLWTVSIPNQNNINYGYFMFGLQNSVCWCKMLITSTLNFVLLLPQSAENTQMRLFVPDNYFFCTFWECDVEEMPLNLYPSL